MDVCGLILSYQYVGAGPASEQQDLVTDLGSDRQPVQCVQNGAYVSAIQESSLEEVKALCG